MERNLTPVTSKMTVIAVGGTPSAYSI